MVSFGGFQKHRTSSRMSAIMARVALVILLVALTTLTFAIGFNDYNEDSIHPDEPFQTSLPRIQKHEDAAFIPLQRKLSEGLETSTTSESRYNNKNVSSSDKRRASSTNQGSRSSNNSTATTSSSEYDYYSFNSGTDKVRRRRRREKHFATLSDVWLCLACALGWAVWLVSSTRPEHAEMLRYQTESSKKVIGHVLQVGLGTDSDGTGIPIYNAVIDYVVQFTEDEPVQVRKRFQTRYLLEEGFANIELLVLADDPTMSVLLDDYLADVQERQKEQPPVLGLTVGTYLLGFVLIGTSIVGAARAVIHMNPDLQRWGWTSLGLGLVLLWPTANIIYTTALQCYRCVGPISDRPGHIIHGATSTVSHSHNRNHTNDCNSTTGAGSIEFKRFETKGSRRQSLTGSSGIAVGGDSKNPFVEVFEDELNNIDNFNQYNNGTMTSPRSQQLLRHQQDQHMTSSTPRTNNLNKRLRATAASMAAALRSYPSRFTNHHRRQKEVEGPSPSVDVDDLTNVAVHNTNGCSSPLSEQTKGFTQMLYGNPHLQRVFSGDRVMCIAATHNTSIYEEDANTTSVVAGGGAVGGSGTNKNSRSITPKSASYSHSQGQSHYVQGACGEFNISLPDIGDQNSSVSSMSVQSSLKVVDEGKDGTKSSPPPPLDPSSRPA